MVRKAKKTKEEAKTAYVEKTTAAKYLDGVDTADAEANYRDALGDFYKITVSTALSSRWRTKAKAKADVYEANTDEKAYEKLYRRAKMGIEAVK